MDDKTLVERCSICGCQLDAPADPTSRNCGGDCLSCMALVAEDPACMGAYIEALQSRIEALEAALRDVFIHGHGEGWRGNQMRRDVKHEDAEKSWSLYVSNGALEKTIARKALESKQ